MKKFAGYIFVCILLASCSATSYLKEGQKYFEGHDAEYISGKSEVSAQLKSEIMSGLDPDATRRFFLSRPGTWLYHQIDTVEKSKGVKNFIKNKLGTKPTYLSDVNPINNANIIESRLKANGFFRAVVNHRVDSTKSRGQLVYEINAGLPYTFDSLEICKSPEELCAELLKAHELEGEIQVGENFTKSALEGERDAITKFFKDKGYYFFNSKLLFFKADSADNERKVKTRFGFRDNIPKNALHEYTLSEVTVDIASEDNNNQVFEGEITTIADTGKFVIKPNKLAPFIALKEGDLYKKANESLTLRHLNKLDVFEFVDLQFELDTANGKRNLKAHINATPKRKQSLRAEAVISTTSTNFTGPGLQLRYSNLNLFQGAEKLNVSATARYEQQLSGSRRGLAAFEYDLEATLLVPRAKGPLRKTTPSGNVPSTKYRAQYRIFDQPDYYAQSSLGLSYGYEWLTKNSTFHELRLVNLDYVKLISSSDRLDDLFESGVLASESFQDQIIFGPAYRITYSPPSKPAQLAHFYISGSFESSGNILYGGLDLTNRETGEDGRYEISGIPFAQYIRSQLDLRTYINISKYTELVLRQNLGIGLPYLNSSNLPFAKQFFVGGASSLRGFQPRSLGPGSYVNPAGDFDSFFDQTGDLLLEWNAEARFDLGGYFRGAVFLDAGNVWLKNASETRPGGEFKWDSFTKQLAVSTGVGLRIDIDFVVVRFDLAFPLRRPGGDNQGWVVDEISIDRDWRRDNLILNFAIGYPF